MCCFFVVQMGAYFGASVIALDLNNDRLAIHGIVHIYLTFCLTSFCLYYINRASDIVVGSPMYRHEDETTNSGGGGGGYDTGCVDVFVRERTSSAGGGGGFTFRRTQLVGFRARSRFGTCVAKLGDVNDDSYGDIAVGAPYDGLERRGVVYIYHGSSSGLFATTPSQVIEGSRYGLATFGHALAGAVDLDANQYPDLIVGAYKSDAVVYIRSKAIVKTRLTTQTWPKVIDLDAHVSASSPSPSPSPCRRANNNTGIW